MMTCQNAPDDMWQDELFCDAFADSGSIIDTVRDAERRATLVFDVLLAFLSDAELSKQRQRPAA